MGEIIEAIARLLIILIALIWIAGIAVVCGFVAWWFGFLQIGINW